MYRYSRSLTLILKVTRDLNTGSGRGESAGKSDDDNVLALDVVSSVDLLDVGEALHELDGGKTVADGNVQSRGGTANKGGRRRSESSDPGGSSH
jgi:hypothetical protein